MRGPVLLRTRSNPLLTPPPAPPRSEAFLGEAWRLAPLVGPRARGTRARAAGRASDSSIPQAVRAPGGGGARGAWPAACGEGTGGRAGVGSSSLADHTLRGPIPSQPLAVSHAGHVLAFVGRAGEGGGGESREGSLSDRRCGARWEL